jgi:hypothetical protein
MKYLFYFRKYQKMYNLKEFQIVVERCDEQYQMIMKASKTKKNNIK